MTDLTPTTQIRGAAPAAGAGVSRTQLKKAALGLAVIAGIFAVGDYCYYWTTGHYLVPTDDAYVDAHSTLIRLKVSGYLSDVPVDDNQAIKAGPVIARIDPRDYQTALDQASANVAAVRATIGTLPQQIAQKQAIRVDTFSSTVVHGRVASLSPASGLQFALLPPPDNATGNLTKIVKRIPVKIEFDRREPLAGRLRPGMSVEPTIDTKPAR